MNSIAFFKQRKFVSILKLFPNIVTMLDPNKQI